MTAVHSSCRYSRVSPEQQQRRGWINHCGVSRHSAAKNRTAEAERGRLARPCGASRNIWNISAALWRPHGCKLRDEKVLLREQQTTLNTVSTATWVILHHPPNIFNVCYLYLIKTKMQEIQGQRRVDVEAYRLCLKPREHLTTRVISNMMESRQSKEVLSSLPGHISSL